MMVIKFIVKLLSARNLALDFDKSSYEQLLLRR